MFANVKEDVRAARRHAGSLRRALLSRGLWFVFSVRLIRWLEHVPVVGRPLRHPLFAAVTMLWRADVAMCAQFGPGLCIPDPFGVVIGPKAVIGARALIGPGVTIGQKSWTDSSIATIGDDVVLERKVAVIGSLYIGTGARIGESSVVICSIPDLAHAAGNPAKVAY